MKRNKFITLEDRLMETKDPIVQKMTTKEAIEIPKKKKKKKKGKATLSLQLDRQRALPEC